MSKLRDYQQEALDALRKGWADGMRRLGISLPTGTGKTHVMAKLGQEEADDLSDNRRVLYLLHRDELIRQTEAKLRATVTPGTSIGVIKAERNELGARILIASIHSLRSEKRRSMLPPIKLCIPDEAHVSVSPTYRAVFDAIGAFDPDGARLAGFSATWTRSDAVGLGDVWEEIVFARSMKWAISKGHLVKPKAIQVGAGVDLSDVREDKAKGDYRESDLGKAVMLEELRDTVIAGAQKHRPDAPSVLFAPTVAAAEFFGDGLRSAGFTVEGIYGHISGAQRRPIFDRHRTGETKILTTCTALAEGWDAPYAERLLLARPTKHEGLFVQIAGRFVRPYPGKSDALILDFVGATNDVKLRNAIDLSKSVMRDIDDELQELIDEEEPEEPVTRERIVRQRKSSYEIDIFAGTSVQWLMGPSNIPFVPCGDSGIVFIVQGREGWYVGHANGWHADGRPDGKFVHEGLNETDALAAASDYAEEKGITVARKSARWRQEAPSDKQVQWARTLGIVGAENMSKGALSDELSVAQATGLLMYFARWSRAQVAA